MFLGMCSLFLVYVCLKRCKLLLKWCLLKGVLRVFTETFKGVSIKFKGCFKEVLGVLTETFKEVSMKFKGCFNILSRVFQGRLPGI